MVAALALGVAPTRIEEVRLVTVGSRTGVQLRIAGPPPRTVVRRDGVIAYVLLEGAVLGGPFSGGSRFEWVPNASGLAPGSPSVGALGIQNDAGGVSVSFRVPIETAIEVRREPTGVTLVLQEPRTSPPAPIVTAAAPQPAAPVAAPLVGSIANGHDAASDKPAPAEPAPAQQAPPRLGSATDTDRVRGLFPGAEPEEAGPAKSAAEEGAEVASAGQLHGQLFPFTPPETQETPAEALAGPPGPRTLTVGFLTLRPSLAVSYVSGETTLESARPVRADYVQIQPGLDLDTAFGGGRLGLAYEPSVRRFSSHDVLEEPTHRLLGRIDLPLGPRSGLKVVDTFTSGVLETEQVDPGHEYFFGLRRFKQNTAAVNASLAVAPRLSIEAGGLWSAVRFDEPVGFFPYDSRSALLGLGLDLTPKLKATLAYVYDRVPPPAERPLVENTAHSVQSTLSGEITPLLSGELTVGYRDQTSPRAPESGRHFRGLAAAGSVTRVLGSASWMTLSVSRATPVSNFESNAFYVTTFTEAMLVLPLAFRLSLDSGIGHRWNAYRTGALELGVPRDDRILVWRAGLRRAFGAAASIAIGYRRDRRSSNLDRFDSTVDGLILQLDFNTVRAEGSR